MPEPLSLRSAAPWSGCANRWIVVGVSFVATLTGVGGGILRDLLLGAAVFILLPPETGFDTRAVAGLVAALALRLCAIRWGWSFPFPNYGKPTG